MARDIQLSSRDYGNAVRKTVAITVTIKPHVRAWWYLRLRLAVHVARLAAWVGGTRFVIETREESE